MHWYISSPALHFCANQVLPSSRDGSDEDRDQGQTDRDKERHIKKTDTRIIDKKAEAGGSVKEDERPASKKIRLKGPATGIAGGIEETEQITLQEDSNGQSLQVR